MMRVRDPISRTWRLGLGLGSIVLMLAAYSLLAHVRQNTVRREQQEVAAKKLVEWDQRRQQLDEQQRQAAALPDAERRQRMLERVERDQAGLEDERNRWQRIAVNPDAEDLTVPTWGMLLRKGLLRASTPQGSFRRKELWLVDDFKATALRLATALVVGVVLSVFLGLLMGCFDPLEAFFVPPFAVLSKVPTTAVLPIFFVLVQINFKMYLAIIVFGMLPTLAQAISQSVRKDVAEELIYKAYTLGASHVE